MRQTLPRVAVAAVALCTFLIPAVGSFAGPRDKLRTTRDQLERLEGRIDVHSAEARSLKKRINALNRDITNIQIEINRLDERIEEIEAEVAVAQQQIDETQEEIDAIEELATKQAVALYKSGATETIDALMDSKSLTELTSRVELLGVAARENTSALVKYGRLREVIRAQSRELFDKKEQLENERAERTGYHERLDEKRRQLADDLTRLNVKLDAERDRERHLASEEKEIEKRILQAQVETDVAELGKSSEGFIWPLNGGISSPFGSRWGSMHTGIDIDGYSGQPIVAAKSGTIISASSDMSGYGNMVIIDHGGGISTLYAHMSDYEVTGGSIGQGKIVGYVGCTGHCYGDHLHFEVRVNGNAVDPMKYLP